MPLLVHKPHDKNIISDNFANTYINEGQISLFKDELNKFQNYLNKYTDSNEEAMKNQLRDLLINIYNNEYGVEVPPTKPNNDLQIFNEVGSDKSIFVIIETKSPKTKSGMMFYENKKSCNLNVKGFHELIGYYFDLQERKNQNPIKNLILTNGYQWFIFSEKEFHDNILNDKSIKKLYLDFKNDRERLYEELSKRDDIYNKSWNTTYFDIRDYQKDIENQDSDKPSQELLQLYKLFSPYHLLGKELPTNDSNILNKKFYKELLHILGLVEDKERKIHRLPYEDCESGSLIENIVAMIDERGVLDDSIYNFYTYGDSKEKQRDNIALELCITWLNRILFIKLLEGQLLRYGRLTNKFMTWENIKDYNDLNKLFFQVLKLPENERSPQINEKFKDIPYLNSSLFDTTDLERRVITISNLYPAEMKVHSSSVLDVGKNKKIDSCEYLLRFLDAYNFASDQTKILQDTNNDNLINASVLGLIFEKINAYEDGAVFTPGIITSYICRETIRKAVVKKFKESDIPNAKQFETINDITNFLSFNVNYIRYANDIIESIKICDPSVGSGHFLVSALNEIILIKSELGILIGNDGKRLRITARIVNDELIFIDEYNHPFIYNPDNSFSQKIQQSIFEEKRVIISKCLYGVDINPKSVSICQLRLWIELLKHAYYKPDNTYKKVSTNVLQTLPNIDVNVKVGNSLLSQISLDTPYSELVEQGLVPEICSYKKYNETYRTTSDREQKRKSKKELIEYSNKWKIKAGEEDKLTSDIKKYTKLVNKFKSQLTEQITLDGSSPSPEFEKQTKDDLEKANRNLELAEKKLEKYLSNKKEEPEVKFSNGFEWRIAFPDVLDNKGEFVGFDCIIGNPPYIQLQKMNKEINNSYKQSGYSTYSAKGDIYCLFYEKGYELLKNGGILGYITSNSWMVGQYGEGLRTLLSSHTNPIILLDCGQEQVFDEVVVVGNILLFSKEQNQGKTKCYTLTKKSLDKLSDYVEQNGVICAFINGENWVIRSSIEQEIENKINNLPEIIRLKDWDIRINFGIKTGCNKDKLTDEGIFIIDGKKKDELIAQDPKSAEIIRPVLRGRDIEKYGYIFDNKWIINTHNGIKKKNIPPINIIEYPSIKAHLDLFYPQLDKRQDKGNTPYNLRNCVYMEDFSKPKMIWKRIGSSLRFCYDETGILSLDSTCIATGNNIKLLVALFNSKMGHYLLKDSPKTGVGDLIVSVQALEPVLIPKLHERDQLHIINQLDLILSAKKQNKSYIEEEKILDKMIFDLYHLSSDEMEYITNYVNEHFP